MGLGAGQKLWKKIWESEMARVGRSGHLLVSLGSQECGLSRPGECEMSEH